MIASATRIRLLLLFGLLAALLATAAPVLGAQERSGQPLQRLEEEAIQAAVARVAPSVVRIETVGGLERIGELLIGTGPTTGLVVSEDGYIISSAFNFVQKPDSILVTMSDGSRAAAKLVATDHQNMLVLLKLNAATKLSPPEFVPRSQMRVGQWAIAVGRTYEGASPNASTGVVSALDRVWGKAIQTDAKISPSNYGGPLVDISGRVLGVLVPMSPMARGEIAGVEWYDSGIGFAVPLERIQSVLPRLEKGEDLQPGLLGISFASMDMFGQPADIAACRGNSPAHKAGLRAGDRVVEADGHPVTRQAELKHQLGARYAGDKVKLVVLRGQERIEREIELAAKLDPYEHPFLGILPMRPIDGQPAGLVIRYVYPGGPADKAGLAAGDVVTSLGGDVFKDAAGAQAKLRGLSPDETLAVEARRGEEAIKVGLHLGRLPEDLPGPLPPSHVALPAPSGERPAVGAVDLKLPEFENQCVAYVPAGYDPRVSYGVVIWLHSPGGFNKDELIDLWRPYCDAHDLILLAPKAAEATKWQPTEVEFVVKALVQLGATYHVDTARIVAHGHAGGGAMAYLVAFAAPMLVHGVAAVDAPLPRQAQPPENDPIHRLAFYTTTAAKGAFAAQTEAGIKLLRSLKYPVSVVDEGDQSRYLTPSELTAMLEWIDSLDRL